MSMTEVAFCSQDAELARRKAREDEMSDEERQKLRDDALKLKAEGNEFYLKDENDHATRKYSEALAMCPLCFKKERAVFFANRAAAKCKMVSEVGHNRLFFLRVGT